MCCMTLTYGLAMCADLAPTRPCWTIAEAPFPILRSWRKVRKKGSLQKKATAEEPPFERTVALARDHT